MILFKSYSNINNFLNRFTILKINTFHIRIHRILSEDKSDLYHNHPFNYISIILKGGYTERIYKNGEIYDVKHKIGSIIRRKHNVFHKILSIEGKTTTFFITWGKFEWKALNTSDKKHEDGVFIRNIAGENKWCKYENGVWHIGNVNLEIAMAETRHSIHQV